MTREEHPPGFRKYHMEYQHPAAQRSVGASCNFETGAGHLKSFAKNFVPIWFTA
jgi:hypothetical protein